MLRGNKGEWSELYVLITLLAEGKLYQSDFNLQRDNENVYEILKAYKAESNYNLEFQRGDEVALYSEEGGTKELINVYSLDGLTKASEILYKGIKDGKGNSFRIIEIDDFIQNSKIQRLKANSGEKADIRLKIYDHRLAKETNLGFSIKSLIGGNSTLFNTGPGNNFIYKINGDLPLTIPEFNSRTYKPPNRISKLTHRLNLLKEYGTIINYERVQSHQLWMNLKMIDGDLPEILSWALYYRWIEREPSLSKVAELLENHDPLNFYNNRPTEQKLYKYKLQRFLTEAAMGMTSEKPWLGEYDSFGGVIIAKNDGDIVCFHIYDFNLFRNYLLENTVFEQPATGEDKNLPGTPSTTGKKKYFYGWLFEENENLWFKINLQVRFR